MFFVFATFSCDFLLMHSTGTMHKTPLKMAVYVKNKNFGIFCYFMQYVKSRGKNEQF